MGVKQMVPWINILSLISLIKGELNTKVSETWFASLTQANSKHV
jgi:hypothetical protein